MFGLFFCCSLGQGQRASRRRCSGTFPSRFTAPTVGMKSVQYRSLQERSSSIGESPYVRPVRLTQRGAGRSPDWIFRHCDAFVYFLAVSFVPQMLATFVRPRPSLFFARQPRKRRSSLLLGPHSLTPMPCGSFKSIKTAGGCGFPLRSALRVISASHFRVTGK